MILPLRSSLIVGVKRSLIVGVKRVGPVLRGRARLKVLSGIGVLSRPKLASDGGSAEVVHALARAHSKGRPDPRHASRRGRADGARCAASALREAATVGLRRNPVPVFHIACSTTASLRATATRAFLKPPAAASFRPQSLRAQGLAVRVSKVVAAS